MVQIGYHDSHLHAFGIAFGGKFLKYFLKGLQFFSEIFKFFLCIIMSMFM